MDHAVDAGLKDEFGRARDWVASKLSVDKCGLLQR